MLFVPQQEPHKEAMYIFKLTILIWLLVSSQLLLAEIYKYQDANGKWQYTDKKPKESTAEVVDYKSSEKKQLGPEFVVVQRQANNVLRVTNPFHAPIEIELRSSQLQGRRKSWLIPAQGRLDLFQSENPVEAYKYRWQLGDSKVTLSDQTYQFPVNTLSCTYISQAFNGRFSHSKDHSRYAVDIAMNVGTPIVAARAGVVVGVKDDYHMGGVNEYFLDKGNYVIVMHEDGSFASYFHILLGTASVKAGDKVKSGQLLAKSGSSGFSSGPHLHFVVSRNADFKSVSVPFHFVTRDGNTVYPTEGLKICDQLVRG